MSLKHRIEAASAKLGLNQQQTAALLRITPEWLSKITRGHVAGSEDIGLRLDAALRARGIEPASIKSGSISGQLAEDPAPYFATGTAPAEPTAKDCMEHLREYLGGAQQHPGGVGYTYNLLRKHLPLGEFQPAGSPLVPVTLPSQTTLLSTETGKPHPSPSRHARPA